MANIFLDAYHNEFGQEDDDKKKKQQQKIDSLREQSSKNIFLDSYHETFPKSKVTEEVPEKPVQQPQQQQPQPKKKGFLDKAKDFIRDVRGITPEMVGQELDTAPERFRDSKVGEFFLGEREGTPVADEYIQEAALKTKQQVAEDKDIYKQKIINFLKDNIKEDSRYRDEINNLTLANFDDLSEGKLARITTNQYNYRKDLRSNTSEFNKATREYNNNLNTLKTLNRTDQQLDETLGYVSKNRGLFKTIAESFRNWDEFFPASAESSNYIVPLKEKKREAYEKLRDGEELDKEDWIHINAIRAEAFNSLVDRGYIDQAGDMLSGTLGFGAEIALVGMIGGEPISPQTATGLTTKISNPTLKKVVSKVLGNSVNMAVKSQVDFPTIESKTAEYMLPTVEYEEWLQNTEKNDVLEYLKDGDDVHTAEQKARLTNLVEYVSEGIGDYIDDALPFVKKAFIGKFLRNRNVNNVTVLTDTLSSLHINSIVSEVIEEEIGEPFLANIEDRDYFDPFMTPEGRERLLVEVLGIGLLRGMSSVADTTLTGARNFRNRTDSKPVEITPDGIKPPPEVVAVAREGIDQPTSTQAREQEELPKQVLEESGFDVEQAPSATKESVSEQTVYRGEAGEVTTQNITYNNVLKVEGYQEQLIQDMAQQGNTAAQAILDNRTNFFKKADALIQETFANEYDAISYTNQNTGVQGREKVGTEYFDLKTGQFYAVEEATAQLYGKQKGRAGKFKQFEEDLNKRIESRTIKFREAPITRANYAQVAKDSSTRIPISLLFTDTDDFQEAASDVSRRGKKAFSKLPVLVKARPDGQFDIIDGNHRVVEALNNEDTGIEVITDENLYRRLAAAEAGEDIPAAPRYIKGKDGKFRGSKPKPVTNESIDRNVMDYVGKDPRRSKFRTNEDQLIPTGTGRNVTTKFLELPEVKVRKLLGKEFLLNLSNSNKVGLKAYEKSVVQEVLNKDFAGQDKVDSLDFRTAVLSKMMPIDIIKSDTYSDYGMRNIALYEDNAKTYILNSPFNHGETGHFRLDFMQNVPKENLEIREITHNGVTQYAVIDKTIPLTEETVADAAINILNSKEGAESYIDGITTGDGKYARVVGKVGLFSHFRAGNVDNTSYIVEIQSDAFQKGVGSERSRKNLQDNIRSLQQDILGDKNRIKHMKERGTAQSEIDLVEERMRGREERLKIYEEQLEGITQTKEEQVFQTYKNIWQERTVREAINIKALEGFEALRFPTARTVAVIEGFSGGEDGNIMPYEIINGDENELVAGDTIDYGGTEYTVVEALTGDSTIVVAPSEDVESFSMEAYMEDDVNARWEDVLYEFEKAEETFGTLDTVEKVMKALEISNTLDDLVEWNNVSKHTAEAEKALAEDPDNQYYKNRLEGLKKVKKPSAADLKVVPKALLDKQNETSYSLGMDYEIKDALNTYTTELDPSDSFSIHDVEDGWRENYLQNYEPDLEGIYQEVFQDGDDVYVLTRGSSEQFSQPDQYEQASSIESFNIEDYDGEQKTVLEFYERKIIPYLKKLRGDNLELVEENGYEWYETKITEEDKAPPTAYRVKEDMKQIGITITDAQEKEIMALNKKFFGDDSIKITEQMLANNRALGSYSAKLIKILSGQINPKDTFYHEAVHKYIDVFLTRDEQIDLFTTAARKYGIDDIAEVEERIAEDFIQYAKSREGVTGKIRHIFDKVIVRIQKYLGNKNAIDALYADLITPVEQKEAVKKTKKVTKTAQKKAAEAPKVYGRGQKKVSTLGAGVEAKAIEAELIEGFADIPEYRQLNVQNQINRAVKLVQEDWESAKAIALGKEQPKYGLAPESVFKAVEDKALEDGDVDLLRQLATSTRVSEATVMGQRIRLLAERNPDSAVNKIREVTEARKAAIEKAKGYNVDKEVKKLKNEVEKQVKSIKKGDWKSFIDSIEC